VRDCRPDLIRAAKLPLLLLGLSLHSAVALAPGEVISADTVAMLLEMADRSDATHDAMDSRLSGPGVDLTLKALEPRHIRAVLARVGGNKLKAARALGLSRSTLDRKLDLLGKRPDNARPSASLRTRPAAAS
jgi:DNA-binding NtrC family response regulator